MATLAKSTRTNTITLGSSTAGPFSVGFRLFDTDELQVYVDGVASTAWTLTADLDNGYDDSATITFDAALDSGAVVVIDGFMKADREEDYPNGGAALVSKMNAELARHAAILQELQRDIQRAPRVLGIESAAIEVGASKLIQMNHAGTAFEEGPILGDIEGFRDDAETAKTAAEAAQTAAEAAQTAAESAWDAFDDLYLGDKASDPATDNDGNALQDGALYFNTTSKRLKVYDLGTTRWVTAVDTASGTMLGSNNLSDVSDAASSRTNIGAQAQADVLDDLATLGTASADGEFLVATGAGAFAWESGATVRASLGLVIGTDVQGYDPATLKADTADQLIAGFTSALDDDGTQSSGTYTPDPDAGNYKAIVNGGAFTLAPPTLETDEAVTITVLITNNGSAGAITTSGFTFESGDAFTTTDGDDFLCRIEVTNKGGTTFSALDVLALQ